MWAIRKATNGTPTRAADRFPGLSRGDRANRRLGDGLRVELLGNSLGKSVGDVEPLRQTIQPGGIVVGKALRRRRPPQRLAQQVQPANNPLDIALLPRCAQSADNPFGRTLDLNLFWFPRFRRGDQRLRHFLEIAISLDKPRCQPVDQCWRWIVRDKVAGELGRDMPCRSGIARNIGQNRPSLLDGRIGVFAAHYGM